MAENLPASNTIFQFLFLQRFLERSSFLPNCKYKLIVLVYINHPIPAIVPVTYTTTNFYYLKK